MYVKELDEVEFVIYKSLEKFKKEPNDDNKNTLLITIGDALDYYRKQKETSK